MSLIKNNINRNIYVIGAPGLENFNSQLLSINKIEKKLRFKLDHNKKILIRCFHPDTTKSTNENLKSLNSFLIFLKKINQNIIFTYPNADKDFQIYINKIEKFSANKNFFLIKNLGKINYFSLLKISDLVIGNSSSGIIETASFKIPTINLGKRQDGRYSNINVINSSFKEKDIFKAYKYAISKKFQNKIKNIKNIYYKKDCSKNFIKHLYDLLN